MLDSARTAVYKPKRNCMKQSTHRYSWARFWTLQKNRIILRVDCLSVTYIGSSNIARRIFKKPAALFKDYTLRRQVISWGSVDVFLEVPVEISFLAWLHSSCSIGPLPCVSAMKNWNETLELTWWRTLYKFQASFCSLTFIFGQLPPFVLVGRRSFQLQVLLLLRRDVYRSRLQEMRTDMVRQTVDEIFSDFLLSLINKLI